MLTPREIVFSIAVPFVLAIFFSLLAWRPWNRATPRGQWAGAVIISGAYVIGFFGLQSDWRFPDVPPANAQDWLLWAAFAVMGLGLIDALVSLPVAARTIFVALFGAGLCWLVLSPIMRNWDRRDIALWLIGSGIATGAIFMFVEATASRVRGLPVPLVLAIGTAGLAMFITFSGSQVSGQRVGLIAIALTGIAIIAAWASQLTLSRGGVLAVVLLAVPATAVGYVYQDNVNAARLLMIAAAPIVGCAAAWLPLKTWKRALLAAVVTAAIVAVPLVPTAKTFFREMSESGYGE